MNINGIWDKVTVTKYGLWTTAGKKFEVSSLCSFVDMAQNVHGSPTLKLSSKCNETLLHYVACRSPCTCRLCRICGPTHKVNKRLSSVATKMLQREQQSMFPWKRPRRQVFLKLVAYIELKKELAGNVFVNSCLTCLSATMVTAPVHLEKGNQIGFTVSCNVVSGLCHIHNVIF